MLKKISIILIMLLIATMVAGCGNNVQSNKMSKQVIPGNSVQKEDSPTENPKVVKKVEHDVLGYGKMQAIALYVYQDAYGAPLSWFITVDEQKMLNLGRDDYDMADINFKDIDGDKRDEILVTRGSGGSAGAGGLNVFKPGASKWKELFAAKNLFDVPSKRFKMKYTGNYKARFEDLETGLKATIPLIKERYKGSENLLPQISSWVDPISDYELKDIDGDGVIEIITTQRVIGISHPDTIALFKTMYKMQNQMYRADAVYLYDDKGLLLGQVKLPALQTSNEIKIITDIKKYSPLMSSVMGIGMTPEFKANPKESIVQYRWTTTNGDFLILGNKRAKEVRNSGEKLLWIPEFQDTSGKSDNIIITLRAEETTIRKILAETNLTIDKDGVFYYVMP